MAPIVERIDESHADNLMRVLIRLTAPAELQEMVSHARIVASALGTPTYGLKVSEVTVLMSRWSLYIVNKIKKGDVFGSHNVRSIRPGKGLPPKHLDAILGRKAVCDIYFGEPLTADMVAGEL